MPTTRSSAPRRLLPLLFLLAVLGLTPARQALAAVNTNTGVSGAPNPSSQGASVTVTASVKVAGTGAPIVAPLTPTATVTFFVDGVQQGLPIPVSTGGSTATFSTTTLAPGPRTITAAFSDATNTYNPSSGSYAQTVKAVPTVGVTRIAPNNANPSAFGQTVTFRATLTGGYGPPTGTVQFSDSGAPLGPPILLNGSAQAQINVSSLPAGPHSIVASYSGDGFNTQADNSGSPLAQTVNPAGTTTIVASSSPGNTSTFGQAVIFAATVIGPAAPTGAVTFQDGGSGIGAAPLDSNGQAVITVSSLSVGSHSITATYNGDADLSPSVGGLTQTVNAEPTTTSVTSSINPSALGQNVTFTVSVTGANGITPAGTVTLTYPNSGGTNTTTGAATLNGNGQAQISAADLRVGTDTVTANYAGSGSFGPGAGSTQQTVTSTTNPVSLTSSANPSSFSQSVTFTATVAASAGVTPTGSIQFRIDGADFGGLQALSAGSANINTSALSVGTHLVTAAYGGDGNYNPGTSGQLTQIVNRTTPGTTVDNTTPPDGPDTTILGQSVTFSATVTGVGGVTPTGTVSFTATPVDPLNNPTGPAITVGSGVLDAGGATQLTASSLPVGRYDVRAVYGGDATYNGSTSAPVTQTVTTAATSDVTLNASLGGPPTASSQFGQTVSFRAAVADNGGGTGPTGTVNFYDGGTLSGAAVTGGTLIGTAGLGANGAPADTAVLPFAGLAGGTHTINAVYGGDSNYGPGGDSITFTVTKVTPGVTVGSNAPGTPPTSTFGQTVTFSATVAGVAGAAAPTGTVTFMDGPNPIGKGVLGADGNPAGVATLRASLPGGPHTVTASYPGDANYAGQASGPYQMVVQKAAPLQTTLTPSSNPSNLGAAVTFTLTVQGLTGATPTGSVTYTDTFKDVTTPLDTVSLTPGANGLASAGATTNALQAGSHTITATYNGDQNYQGSQRAVTQTVNTSGTSVSVVSSSPPPADQLNGLPTSVFGQPVTFTARVTSAKGVTPTGNVTFTDTNGAPLGDPAALTPAGPPGVAVASITTAALSVGSHAVTASYPGDANNNVSAGTVTQQVNPAGTATALTSRPNPSSLGQTVTFTTTVTVNAPGAGTPTGTVTFQEVGAAQPLGTAPLVRRQDGTLTATFTATALRVAINPALSVTATYGGDASFLGSTSPVVNQAVFDVAPTITRFDPPFLLVPGTARDRSHDPLGATDPQRLTITGRNIRQGATVFVNGDRLSPEPGSVAPDGSSLTVLIPPQDVAVAGLARVLVQNPQQVPSDPNTPDAPVSLIPVNPVMVLPNFPVPSRPDKFLRMFSTPFDYSTVSPYDVLKGVALSPPLDGNGYNPDVNILSDFPFGLSSTTTPLYHWDPASLLYQTTRADAEPGLGLQPADLHLLLGQAYWVVGGRETQQLGIMQRGTATGFNPTGLPLLRGWNMVGSPFPRDLPLSSLRVLTQGGATLTFSDAVSAGLVGPILWSWDGAQYVANFDGAVGGNGLLRQYEGYWFFSYQPCTLLVTLPQQ